MRISACRTYHSKTVHRAILRMPDGRSVFKVYFLSIIGRDDPTRYEWGRGDFTMEQFLARLENSGAEGVGFITSFPHITKLFRAAPSMETVFHVRAFSTRDMDVLGLARDEGFEEFACYAEAAIAADEFHAWARAGTVADYLQFQSDFEDGPVRSNTKLATYWSMLDADPDRDRRV
jgi:hypothetical protein